jgi:hypothetical protein
MDGCMQAPSLILGAESVQTPKDITKFADARTKISKAVPSASAFIESSLFSVVIMANLQRMMRGKTVVVHVLGWQPKKKIAQGAAGLGPAR